MGRNRMDFGDGEGVEMSDRAGVGAETVLGDAKGIGPAGPWTGGEHHHHNATTMKIEYHYHHHHYYNCEKGDHHHSVRTESTVTVNES